MHTVRLLKDRTEASGQKNLEGQFEEGPGSCLSQHFRGGCGWSLQVTQTLLEQPNLLGPECL